MRILANYGMKTNGESYTVTFETTGDVPAEKAPAGTKSFVLIMDAPDVPMPGGFTHWVLADISASTKELPEGFTVGSLGVSANSGFRRPGYAGPCPPTGVHHYHFKLSALDVDTIGVAQGASRADVEKAMAGHVIATTETIGLYQKQPK